ncbi:hypothetical protein F2P81_005364 [Scophthalmus maximus]|uniref:Uncharacterized protein n=1 Tax=Scophthalmus maximus TaxID=52904 RepID=A0A6A4TIG7_SCOMX|nr:hypothetical protein F2P81_005364 [Scophthalmus maximus]
MSRSINVLDVNEKPLVKGRQLTFRSFVWEHCALGLSSRFWKQMLMSIVIFSVSRCKGHWVLRTMPPGAAVAANQTD